MLDFSARGKKRKENLEKIAAIQEVIDGLKALNSTDGKVLARIKRLQRDIRIISQDHK